MLENAEGVCVCGRGDLALEHQEDLLVSTPTYFLLPHIFLFYPFDSDQITDFSTTPGNDFISHHVDFER